MNGLEEIVLAIKQKAAAEGDEIKKRARTQADAIRDGAAAEAEAESEKTLLEAERRCARIVEAAELAAVSNRSKELLKYKSGAVRRVIEDMLEDLRALPADEYFAVIEKLIYANCHKNESGTVSFGRLHAAELPDGFLDKINQKLSESGAALKAGAPADTPDGFVLCYGDIEENCAFDAIISSKEDELKDKTAAILFAKAEA